MQDNDVIVTRQDEISVYQNKDGGITIKQTCWPDEDQIVYFHRRHAEAIINAVLRVCNEIDGENK